jgi:hypothetical protein
MKGQYLWPHQSTWTQNFSTSMKYQCWRFIRLIYLKYAGGNIIWYASLVPRLLPAFWNSIQSCNTRVWWFQDQ